MPDGDPLSQRRPIPHHLHHLLPQVFPGTQRMCDKFIAKLKIIIDGDVNEKGKKSFSSLGVQAISALTLKAHTLRLYI